MKDEQSHLQSLFKKSALALQNGDYRSAKKGFEKIARKAKDNALVWYNLGLSNQYLDDHRNGILAYKKAIRINPKMNDAVVNLALSHHLLGDSDSALSLVSKLLTTDKENVRANNLLGSLLAAQGKYQEARDLLVKFHALNPHDNEIRFNLANTELELGNVEEAGHLLAPLLVTFSEDAKYLQLQAQILIHKKEFDGAVAIISKLKDSQGESDDVLWLDLSLRETSRSHFHVIDLCNTLLERNQEDPKLWNSLGNAYFQLDGISKASEAYQKAVDFDPNNPEFLNNRGLAYSSLGDKENAERYYRMSIEANPEYAETYRNLVAMKRFESMEDPDAEALTTLWKSRSDDPLSTKLLAFSLGKVYDDCGEYDKSFETYKIGNDLQFAESWTNIEAYLGHIDRVPMVLDQKPSQVSQHESRSHPIFVLGMPRSGTTLVEQILSRHSLVTGCGELPCIERAITRLEKNSSPARVYPDDFQVLSESELTKEASAYHGWVDKLHNIDTSYFVDKMPFNFVHVWLIKAMFPGSSIVNCQRHPLDVIISNYFQLYGSDVGFVYNLEVLANYYIRYFEVMKKWNEIFKGEIYNVSYEELVTDHENQAKQLVAGVGLPWDERCIDSKKTSTAVRTASIWQVRQGVYTHSKERWRNYEKQLEPVVSILKRAGILDEKCRYLRPS
ncbi:MAG: tetratricopeptide repeat protein [Gammaproteobacteria bacterium]|nr:tetratricopeptide repeat protein [Gammaproteobacteria bacterium]